MRGVCGKPRDREPDCAVEGLVKAHAAVGGIWTQPFRGASCFPFSASGSFRQLDLRAVRRRVDNIESFRTGIAFRETLIGCLERRDALGARKAMEDHFGRIARLYFDPVET
jgi:hypothetical protein